jgi:hypothetical protein
MKDGFNRDCVDLVPVSIGNGFVEMTMKDGFNRDCVDLVPVSIGNGFVEMELAEHFVIFQNGELFGFIDNAHYRLHYSKDVTEAELNAYLDIAEIRLRCAIPSDLLVNIATMLESVYWLDKLKVGLRDAFLSLDAYH